MRKIKIKPKKKKKKKKKKEKKRKGEMYLGMPCSVWDYNMTTNSLQGFLVASQKNYFILFLVSLFSVYNKRWACVNHHFQI